MSKTYDYKPPEIPTEGTPYLFTTDKIATAEEKVVEWTKDMLASQYVVALKIEFIPGRNAKGDHPATPDKWLCRRRILVHGTLNRQVTGWI